MLHHLSRGVLALALLAGLAPILWPDPALAATTVDLSPLVGEAFAGIAAVLVAVIGWGVRRYIGIQLEDQARDALSDAVWRIAHALFERHGYDLRNVDVKYEALATGVDYLQKGLPESLRRLGATKEALTARLEANLDQVIGIRTREAHGD